MRTTYPANLNISYLTNIIRPSATECAEQRRPLLPDTWRTLFCSRVGGNADRSQFEFQSCDVTWRQEAPERVSKATPPSPLALKLCPYKTAVVSSSGHSSRRNIQQSINRYSLRPTTRDPKPMCVLDHYCSFPDEKNEVITKTINVPSLIFSY